MRFEGRNRWVIKLLKKNLPQNREKVSAVILATVSKAWIHQGMMKILMKTGSADNNLLK